MSMGLGFALPALRQNGFSPLSLFASGAQGVWYDDSLTSSMYQGSTQQGATPAALESPVGLQLDLSQGLALGSELVVNGDFSGGTTTGWTAEGGATLSVDSGRMKVVTTGSSQGASQALTGLVVNTIYQISVTVTVGGADWIVLLGNSWAQGQGFSSGQRSTSQTYSIIYHCTSAAAFVFSLFSYGAGTTYYDNITVKSIAGNHRTQATSANRPTLSARYNLLTKTEDFSNAAWTAVGTSIATTNPITAPNGGSAYLATQTTGYINSAAITVSTSVLYTATQYFYAGTATWIQFGIVDNILTNGGIAWFNIATGAIGSNVALGLGSAPTAYSITPVSGFAGWYVISYTGLPYSTSARTFWRAVATDGSSVSIAATYYPFGADVRPANQATGLIPTYQRVDTSSVYDTVGFPQYLKYNGSNSSLSTASINFTATAQMGVFSGLRKISVITAVWVELSTSVSTNNGSFLIDPPDSADNTIGVYVKGTILLGLPITSSTVISPATITSASQLAIATSGTTISNNLNGSLINSSTGSTGTGNFGNYPLYFGARAGTSFFFNGYEFQTIIVGKTLTATEISNTETYVNSKTKAY